VYIPSQVPSLKKQVRKEQGERAKRERDLSLEMESIKVSLFLIERPVAGDGVHQGESLLE
jgi:hypothetical protein